PHRQALGEIFQAAGIEYGRIDYSVLDGRIVTWEINTNPTIAVPWVRLAESRKVLQPLFMDPFADALKALVRPCSDGPVKFAVTSQLLCDLKLRRRDRAIRATRKFGGKIARKIGVKRKR